MSAEPEKPLDGGREVEAMATWAVALAERRSALADLEAALRALDEREELHLADLLRARRLRERVEVERRALGEEQARHHAACVAGGRRGTFTVPAWDD